MNSYDYYGKGEAVAQRLEIEGLDQYAKGIRDAIRGGSTATEILVALRWQLRKVLDCGEKLGDQEMIMVKELVEKIDDILE